MHRPRWLVQLPAGATITLRLIAMPTLTKVVDGAAGAFPNPNYGQLEGLGIALFVLLVILGLIRFFTGFVANVAVLLGIIAGAVLATLLGVMHFERVVSASGSTSSSRCASACRNFNWFRSSPCASSW